MAVGHRSRVIALVGVILLILASGWVGLVVDRAIGADPTSRQDPGVLLWLVAPLVLGIVYWLAVGRFPIGLRPRFWRWGCWLVALLAFPVVTMLAVLLGWGTGSVSLARFSLSGLLVAVAMAIPGGIVKNIFEEFTWRGLLVGELVRAKLSDAWIYLLSGGIWGLWHAPYYLGFLQQSEMDAVMGAPVHPALFFALALVALLAWGVMFAELYRVSGTIWTVVLLHTMEDAFVNSLIRDGHATFSTPSSYVFSPVVGLVSSACYLAIGLLLRRVRLRRG